MSVYRIEIRLSHCTPRIWRRVEVLGATTLEELHDIIQTAMGWKDLHAHLFSTARGRFGPPDQGGPPDLRSERTVTVEGIAREGDVLLYEYDFGDAWEHRLRIESVEAPLARVRYPRCTAGARACPPEDCGGPAGYQDLLAALADPRHDEHDVMRPWVGPEFDPEAFDVDAVNEGLGRWGA